MPGSGSNAQAGGSYLTYDPQSVRYTLPPEQAIAITVEDSPAFLPSFFQIALGTAHDLDAVLAAARSGTGVGWHEHVTDVHVGCERFFRPSYLANLVGSWLPALDGVVDKLQLGACVADVGCGHGASTILMAKAFPNSTFIGSDYHNESIAIARQRAADAGVADRVTFEVAGAQEFSGADDIVDVLNATGTDGAVLVALSCGVTWSIRMAAGHPDRVAGVVAIGASCGFPISSRNGICSGGASPTAPPTAWPSTTGATGSTATTTTTTTSCSSSSKRCSPNRTRPNRSKTASAGATRSTRRRWPTPPQGGWAATARSASRWRHFAGRCGARCW